MKLMIDDEPIVKCGGLNLDPKGIDLAETWEDGTKKLSDNPVYDVLYLDYKLPYGSTGLDVLNWLADHLDKVPREIIPISSGFNGTMAPYIYSLKIAADRARQKSNFQP
jgi:hypothetical protein